MHTFRPQKTDTSTPLLPTALPSPSSCTCTTQDPLPTSAPSLPSLTTPSAPMDRPFSLVPGHSRCLALALTFTPPLTHSSATMEYNPNQAKPAAVLLFREVACVDGLAKVQVPFSLSKLSHVEQKLGFYISNSTSFIEQFQYTSQSFNLTFHGISIILSNNLLSEKCGQIWEQARYMQTRFINHMQHAF